MTLEILSQISTGFIVASGASLLLGVTAIKKKRPTLHRNLMLLATTCAAFFLVAYVSRWYLFGSKAFQGEGGWRVLYLGILLPHILLAIGLGPMVLRMIDLAVRKKDFEKHKRLGRITAPVWLFVAISGWTIYAMLYILF